MRAAACILQPRLVRHLPLLFFVLSLSFTVEALVIRSPKPTTTSRLSRLQLFDPNAVIDSIPPTGGPLDEAVSSFFATFSSRVGGALIGNLVAGIVIKIVTDLVLNRINDGKRAKEEKEAKRRESENVITTDAWLKLFACLFLDLVGDSSFALPGIGELEDVAWAPVSSFALKLLFGSNAIAGLDFAKEILPGTDVLPVATLAWCLIYLSPGNPVAKALGLPSPESPMTDRAKDDREAKS